MGIKRSGLVAAVIGKDGRTTAISKALDASRRVQLPTHRLSTGKALSSESNIKALLDSARRIKPDFVVVGPEDPLAAGVVDRLESELGIPCVGPKRKVAQLESSKAFTRQLLTEFRIPGNVRYQLFDSIVGISDYLTSLSDFVVKPDGLTGGKGVKVSGVHIYSIAEAVDYCKELLDSRHPLVVIEEKLDGEEFTLQSFCDGSHVVDMVVVQDHKRAYEGDTGPNTGGMGSYTCEDHSLPFLNAEALEAASQINSLVADAVYQKTGEKFKGVLFGGFMATRDGVRLLEYNVRFGDPESLNIFALLETDFVDICESILTGTLDPNGISFARKATVCKYVVPLDYPTGVATSERISSIPTESDRLKVYAASIDQRDGDIYLEGSRAVAFVGIGNNLAEAEEIAEAAASSVVGPVRHRRDIGTHDLILTRVRHMEALRAAGALAAGTQHPY